MRTTFDCILGARRSVSLFERLKLGLCLCLTSSLTLSNRAVSTTKSVDCHNVTMETTFRLKPSEKSLSCLELRIKPEIEHFSMSLELFFPGSWRSALGVDLKTSKILAFRFSQSISLSYVEGSGLRASVERHG